MVGLEPGNVAFVGHVGHAAKPQEGMHLVEVAPYGFCQHGEAMNERIAVHIDQRALTMADAPDELIEQRVSFRIAMTDDKTDELGNVARQRDWCCVGRR